MSTKEELINLIKEWIDADNNIKKLQDVVKVKKEQKKNLTEDLLKIMKENEIECFDINKGKLLYTQRKTKKAVSKKTLLETLNNYFKDNEGLATDLTSFILDSREEKITETIRRKNEK